MAAKIFAWIFILFLLPYALGADIIASYQSRGLRGDVIEYDKGMMLLRIEVDLGVYAKGSKTRKRAQKIIMEILEQIRDTENIKVTGKKHYLTDTHEIYETYFVL